MPLLSDIAKEKKKLKKETKKKNPTKEGKVLNLDRFPHFAAALMPLLHLNSTLHLLSKYEKYEIPKYKKVLLHCRIYSALFTLTVQRTLT